MNVIIVDNEKKIVEGLEVLLKTFFPEVKVIGSAGSVKQAVHLLNQTTVDLLFLDIELDDGIGMNVLKQMEDRPFKVIFITAYDKYAVDAFKYCAIDFLLKPIDSDDLVAAVRRAQREIKKEKNNVQWTTFIENLDQISLQNKKMIVSDKDHIHALPIKDIYYLEADGAYTKFILKNQTIISSKNLKNYETFLWNAGFFRTHHSFLVNLAHMDRFDKVEGVLVLDNKQQIAVSYRKKEALLDRIKQLYVL